LAPWSDLRPGPMARAMVGPWLSEKSWGIPETW